MRGERRDTGRVCEGKLKGIGVAFERRRVVCIRARLNMSVTRIGGALFTAWQRPSLRVAPSLGLLSLVCLWQGLSFGHRSQ